MDGRSRFKYSINFLRDFLFFVSLQVVSDCVMVCKSGSHGNQAVDSEVLNVKKIIIN